MKQYSFVVIAHVKIVILFFFRIHSREISKLPVSDHMHVVCCNDLNLVHVCFVYIFRFDQLTIAELKHLLHCMLLLLYHVTYLTPTPGYKSLARGYLELKQRTTGPK